MSRYRTLSQAEHYRDRFKKGWRRSTHTAEWEALRCVLGRFSPIRTLLDLGCGPGRFVPLLATFARQVIEMDYSSHMLDVARQDYPPESSRAVYVQADARSVPLADRSVDVVFCHRLLNHITESAWRTQILSECCRVTCRHVVVSCLAPLRVLRGMRRMRTWIFRRRPHGRDVAESELLNEARDAGLRLVSRACIRRFPIRGDFLVFEKQSSA